MIYRIFFNNKAHLIILKIDNMMYTYTKKKFANI